MSRKLKLWTVFLSGLSLGIIAVATVAYTKADPSSGAGPAPGGKDEARPQYKWVVPQVPTGIQFAGEQVPLDRWEVRERLQRELVVNMYQHASIMYILMLSGRYFPIIEERLKANDVPDDFKYLCVAESSLQQNALSGAGAASFWQFMKDTGPNYGLEVNDEVDQRFQVEKATDAACKYFKDAQAKFGSWTAAAASYNCGQKGYSNQVEFQQSANYYDLIFPDETNRYVFRILALKSIISNARNFGFFLEADEAFKPLKARYIDVDKTVDNLNDFARANGTTYKMLKIYNPWLRAHKLTVRPGKSYKIALPL